MSLTLNQMVVRASLLLEDTTNARWSADLTTGPIAIFLNDAQRDFATRTKVVKKKSAALGNAATTPLYAFYTLPSDFLNIESVWVTVGGNEMELPGVTVKQLGGNWTTQTSDIPTAYIDLQEFGNTELRVWPYPSAAALTGLVVYYAAVPADLTTGQTTPIPPAWHTALVNYAVAMCNLTNKDAGDPAKAVTFMQMYETQVTECLSHAVRRFSSEGAYVRYTHV